MRGSYLPPGYEVQAGSEPDKENLTVELHAPDGIVAVLSMEPGDDDVTVNWPVDPHWERSESGRISDVLTALAFAREYLIGFGRTGDRE